MNKKEKKIISHKFLNKYTIPGALLLMLCGFLLCEFVIPMPITMISGMFGIAQGNNIQDLEPVAYISAALGTFVVLAVYKRWFYPEFDGCLNGNFAETARAAVMIIPFWILTCIKEISLGTQIQPLTIRIIAASLMAGCCEETVFRGLGISYLMRQWKKENKITSALLFTSVCFGLFHGMNIFSGAGIANTLIQIVSTSFIGMFLGAVFLRGGNLLPVMIIHTLHDILAGLTTAEGFTLTHALGLSDWLDMVLCIALGCAGLYLIRKEKRAGIIELWGKKWSGTVAGGVQTDVAQQ